MPSLSWKKDFAYAVSYLGKNEQGKQIRQWHPLGQFERKRDGKDAFARWLIWNGKGKGKRILFSDLIKSYLEFSKSTKSARTHFGEENHSQAIKLEFGDLPTHEITSKRVEVYMGKHPTWKPTTWRNRLGLLKQMLRYADQHGFETEDPFKTVKIPHPKLYQFATRAVPIEYLDQILQAAPDQYKCFLGLMRYTGARPVEISRLKVADLDRANLKVRLFGKNKFRVIAVPKEVLPYFDHLNVKVRLDTLSHVLKKVCKALDLPLTVSPYMFRHSVATHLSHKGFGLRDLQEYLGQSTPAITARYTTVSTQSFVKMADALK